MSSFLYFAYGSNMLTARLAARCPSAQALSVAQAANYQVDFSKKGQDDSGKATLIRQGGTVQTGILFQIADTDLSNLDTAEGDGYTRVDDFNVLTENDGAVLTCKTYIARQHHPGLAPFDWYLALIVAGAIEHSLPQEVITALRSNQVVPDPQADRPARTAAFHALRRSGHDNLDALLKR